MILASKDKERLLYQLKHNYSYSNTLYIYQYNQYCNPGTLGASLSFANP